MGKDSARFAALVEATNAKGQTPLQYCASYRYHGLGMYLVQKAGAIDDDFAAREVE